MRNQWNFGSGNSWKSEWAGAYRNMQGRGGGATAIKASTLILGVLFFFIMLVTVVFPSIGNGMRKIGLLERNDMLTGHAVMAGWAPAGDRKMAVVEIVNNTGSPYYKFSMRCKGNPTSFTVVDPTGIQAHERVVRRYFVDNRMTSVGACVTDFAYRGKVHAVSPVKPAYYSIDPWGDRVSSANRNTTRDGSEPEIGFDPNIDYD